MSFHRAIFYDRKKYEDISKIHTKMEFKKISLLCSKKFLKLTHIFSEHTFIINFLKTPHVLEFQSGILAQKSIHPLIPFSIKFLIHLGLNIWFHSHNIYWRIYHRFFHLNFIDGKLKFKKYGIICLKSHSQQLSKPAFYLQIYFLLATNFT